MRKVLTTLFIFFVSGIIISLILLTVAENFIINLNQSSAIETAKKDSNNDKSYLDISNKVVLPSEEYNVQFSYDNKYYTYLKDNKIYIYSIDKNEEIKVIEDTVNDGIVFYQLLYDKNMIVYFTEKKAKNSSTLQIKTYNIDSKTEGTFNKFTVYNFNKIKAMHTSPVINILYINVEIGSGNNTTNTIYTIDLFNSLDVVKSGVQIKNHIMLQYTDNVFFEYSNGNIYYWSPYSGNTRLTFFNEDVEMIGLDKDDNVYFIGKESKNKIYKVNKTRLVKTIELTDKDVVKTYSNNRAVYVVYPTYAVCVSAENPYFRVCRLSKYVDFMAVRGNKVYLKTSSGILTLVDLVKE